MSTLQDNLSKAIDALVQAGFYAGQIHVICHGIIEGIDVTSIFNKELSAGEMDMILTEELRQQKERNLVEFGY